MKPTILVVGNTETECNIMINLLTEYAEYIDYETLVSNISEYDYYNYNNIIPLYSSNNTNTNNNNDNDNNIKILVTNNTDENYISHLMKKGFDMVIPHELNKYNAKHMINIYYMINEYYIR